MLLQPLLDHAKARPDAKAVVDERGAVTWGELLKKSRKLAKVLRASTRRANVAVLLPAGGGFVATFYATMFAGKVVVPVNFLLGENETRHVLKDSGVDLVVSVKPLLDRLDAGKAVREAEAAGEVRVLDLLALKPSLKAILAQLRPLPSPKRSADDLAAILYTSGTSGLPKGVCLTHGNLDGDVRACITHARLDRVGHEHVFLGVVPLFHSTGLLATMIAPIALGAKAVYTQRFSPAGTIKAIREHGVTVMAAVPSMYNAISRVKDAGPADFAKMYAAISGGEPLPGRIRETFRRRFDADLMEGYGLTETCGPICVNMPHAHKPGSVGQLIPGCDVHIVGEDGQPVPSGETGEIWIKGPMVFQGYLNLPDQTQQAKTSEGFFKTGDLGRVDEEGYVHITGRAKDMLIVSGENVYPREIEELITQMEGIDEAAVIGRADESRGEVPVAFVIAAEGCAVSEEQVKAFLRDRNLANFKVPREVRVVEDLPRSPTGKVLKRELAARLQEPEPAGAAA